MKRRCIILLIMLLGGMISSCANAGGFGDAEALTLENPDKTIMTPEENNIIANARQSKSASESDNREKPTRDDIRLELVEDLLNRGGATFRIVNLSDQMIEYGRSCRIEKSKGDGWEQVPFLNENFEVWADAFGLYANSTSSFEQNWKELYGSLPTGKYRLSKEYFWNNEEYWAYCEFEIKEETEEGDDTTDYYREFFKLVESTPS